MGNENKCQELNKINKNNNESIDLKNLIKSAYIKKNIFLHLKQKKILQLIKHNKHYQNLLKINIENYMKIAKKKIIIQNNGKVKEYNVNNNKLIYEGEYLNGHRHGKGKKYYDNGQLKFEGIYLNLCYFFPLWSYFLF